MKHLLTLLLFAAVFAVAGAEANTGFLDGKPAANVVFGRGGTLICLAPDGKEVWKHQVGGLIHDLTVLPNGNVLYANGTVAAELDSARKPVWEYRTKNPKGGGPYSVQRLADGATVVGENSTGVIMTFNASGEMTDSFTAIKCKAGSHGNLRLVRKTPKGTFLVCHSGEKVVREYKPDGAVIAEQKQPPLAFKAEPLPNGHMMVSSLDRIVEYDAAKKVVWEFKADAIPGVTIRNMTGFQRLPNGNLLIGCYSPYAKDEGNSAFEITRGKKLVWRYHTPKNKASVMAVGSVGR